MLRIAGKTAEPIELTFLCGHSWVAGGCHRLKKKISTFFQIFYFFQD